MRTISKLMTSANRQPEAANQLENGSLFFCATQPADPALDPDPAPNLKL